MSIQRVARSRGLSRAQQVNGFAPSQHATIPKLALEIFFPSGPRRTEYIHFGPNNNEIEAVRWTWRDPITVKIKEEECCPNSGCPAYHVTATLTSGQSPIWIVQLPDPSQPLSETLSIRTIWENRVATWKFVSGIRGVNVPCLFGA
ncbi:MAG: hypothetical protein M1820_000175 [Bogoriella megaspora]|nr:MAG: hypothetical protein M1820_000175 [Bogoriella megaspora]